MKRIEVLPSFEVRITFNGQPLGGAFMIVHIPMRAKNSFALCLGPADDKGWLAVTRETLIDEAMKEKRLFMMDYLDPEMDRQGTLIVQPMGLQHVMDALSAYDAYQEVGEYSQWHAQNLRQYQRMLRSLGKGTARAEITTGSEEVMGGTTELGDLGGTKRGHH